MIKIFRIIVVVCFLVVSVFFATTYIEEYRAMDNTLPVITVKEDKLELSVNDGEEKLLEGITAFDEKDGDITDKVIVESVSKFIKPGVCKVKYAVCDSNNHVANATRKVVYTDYKAPKFTLNKSICFSLYQSIDVKSAIGATDCFDGSLDSNIIITSPDFKSAAEGVYTIEASVTNSKGDVAKLKLPLIVENRSLSAPVIELRKYLVYLEKGEEFDLEKNLLKITDHKGEKVKATPEIDTNLNFQKDGTYTVHYYATDSEGYKGHSVMTVIVGSGNNEG